MPITKSDLNKALNKALLQQQKNIIGEISAFLEKNVINKLFNLENNVEEIDRKLDKAIDRADYHGKKLDNHEERIDNHEERISSLETSRPQI